MKKTFAQKVLGRAAGKDVYPGEIVIAEPDYCLSTENASASYREFEAIGMQEVKHPERVVVVFDHTVPAATVPYAFSQQEARRFITEQGIVHAYDLHDFGGICHQIMCQEGYAAPGRIIVGADSHTCTSGALGAFATGIGRTEVASVWATGSLWFKVPESMKITVNGAFRPGVAAKDLILRIIGDIGTSGADYLSVEFHGSGIEGMSIADRMTLCNMGVEMGAKTAVCRPDEKVMAFLRDRLKEGYCEPVWADEGAEYVRELTYDLKDIVPAVAAPGRVDNYTPASKLQGTPIQQAFIGSCTNGRLKDLREAAAVLKGKKVQVRTMVTPASCLVYEEALKDGTIEILLRAGCTINPPGCGACFGGSGGLLAKGERCISTTNRNFKGRMGDKESFVYLASPITVACSALNGRITDPQQFLKEGCA